MAWKLRNGSCASGAEALQALREAHAAGDPYDIAILDYQMPEMDGEMLGRAIKADPELRGVCLLMLTSLGVRGNEDRLHEAGFAACLAKPARQSELLAALMAVWSRRNEPSGPMITHNSLATTQRTHSATPVRFSARVLLAEDNIVNQKIAVMTLESLGCRVDVAANGREAVEMLDCRPYDIVFMDCEMPEMDGFEATFAIRQRAAGHAQIPIVAVTAKAISGDREKCLAAGMNDYISKPVRPNDFRAALERWVAPPLAETESAEEESALHLSATNSDLSDPSCNPGDPTCNPCDVDCKSGDMDSKLGDVDSKSGDMDSKSGDMDCNSDRLDEAPASDASVLDGETIARLRELCAATDPALLDEIFDSFRRDGAERLHILREAHQNNDTSTLRKAAHALKGASANVGALKLAQSCAILETKAESGDTDGAGNMVQRICGDFDEVQLALNAEMANRD
jgi:CheY-like chemotaxis protein/HPt (histidine-containing phosphotransfer) domain-containing protein